MITIARGNYLKYTPSDLEFILLIVSMHTGITIEELRGESKARVITIARQLYCYMAFKYTENSTKNIGKHIGERDFSTACSAIRMIEDLIFTSYAPLISILNYCDIQLSGIYKPVKRSRHVSRPKSRRKAA